MQGAFRLELWLIAFWARVPKLSRLPEPIGPERPQG